MSEPATEAPQAPAESTAAPAAQQMTDEKEPNWLPSRLERERKAIAKRFGVENLDELEAAVKEARDLKQAQLSETEKLRSRVAELEKAAKRASEYESSLKVYAQSQLAGLTAEQKAAVEDIAGDDPSAVVRTIEKLRPTWKAQAAPPAPLPAPASTAPSAPAAPPAGSATGPNHYQIWQQLKATNALQAADYLLRHEAEIVSARRGQSQ